MGLFNNNVNITMGEDPFKNDLLNRKEDVEQLTKIFSVVDNQMVLAISSPWGTGKTSFLKMWDAYLKSKEFNTVFFNCWENDHVDEPFIAFVEEIKASLEKDKLIDDDFNEKALNVGRNLVEKTLNVGLNLGRGIIESKTGLKFELFKDSALIESMRDLQAIEIEEITQKKISTYHESKKAISDFKDVLSNIGRKDGKRKPIIIFVDELDRCKPEFAIQTLERIKHIFNVENVIFVLGIDKDALSGLIKTRYGNNVEMDGYLSRFIDLEFSLDRKHINSTVTYITKLIQDDKYKFYNILIKSNANIEFVEFIELCQEILNSFNFSLRVLEKVITKLYFILKSNEVDGYQDLAILTFLVGLSFKNKKMYDDIYQKRVSIDEVLKIFSEEELSKDEIKIVAACLSKHLNPNEEFILNLSVFGQEKVNEEELLHTDYIKAEIKIMQIYKAIDKLGNFIF